MWLFWYETQIQLLFLFIKPTKLLPTNFLSCIHLNSNELRYAHCHVILVVGCDYLETTFGMQQKHDVEFNFVKKINISLRWKIWRIESMSLGLCISFMFGIYVSISHTNYALTFRPHDIITLTVYFTKCLIQSELKSVLISLFGYIISSLLNMENFVSSF